MIEGPPLPEFDETEILSPKYPRRRSIKRQATLEACAPKLSSQSTRSHIEAEIDTGTLHDPVQNRKGYDLVARKEFGPCRCLVALELPGAHDPAPPDRLDGSDDRALQSRATRPAGPAHRSSTHRLQGHLEAEYDHNRTVRTNVRSRNVFPRSIAEPATPLMRRWWGKHARVLPARLARRAGTCRDSRRAGGET